MLFHTESFLKRPFILQAEKLKSANEVALSANAHCCGLRLFADE